MSTRTPIRVVVISGKAQAGKDTLACSLACSLGTVMNDNFSFCIEPGTDAISFRDIEASSVAVKPIDYTTSYTSFWKDVNDMRERSDKFSVPFKMSFADPLKNACKCIFPRMTDEHLWGSNDQKKMVIPEYGMSSRQILEQVGTDLFRNQFSQDVWVQATADTIKNIVDDYSQLSDDYLNTLEHGVMIFIPDCRFPNEVDQFDQLLAKEDIPATFIRLTRNPLNRDTEPETALDGYDWESSSVRSSCVIDNRYLTIPEVTELAVYHIRTTFGR